MICAVSLHLVYHKQAAKFKQWNIHNQSRLAIKVKIRSPSLCKHALDDTWEVGKKGRSILFWSRSAL